MNQKGFSILLGVLLLVFLATGFSLGSDGFAVNNIVPELCGVFIELLIILWVFHKWREKSKQERLISLERRLREYLVFFLKHNFKSLPKEYQVGRFFGKDHSKNKEQLDKLLHHIRNMGLDENVIISIQDHCGREARTLTSLLPVASELTNEHFKAWCRIVHFVNCIVDRKDSVSSSTIDIIQNIKRFDTASYKYNLYVGAINA